MGIFPLLVNASMQVRPVLLNMYETYFLPLGKSLQHCIDGMLLALLPGDEKMNFNEQNVLHLLYIYIFILVAFWYTC